MEQKAAIQLITADLVESIAAQAQASPRRRKNYNFHDSDTDNPHRFLNVFLEGSYVRPHRHRTPPKAESFVVLSGQMVAVVFEDDGRIASGHLLGDGPFAGKLPACVANATVARGINVRPGLYHTIAALSPVAVCYEVKPGPWDPATDKEFAPWAPEEGADAAAEYLRSLLV